MKYTDQDGNEINADTYERALEKLLDWNGMCVKGVEE